ncbi:hypothetical protein THAOC_30722, partial [Thalassiosira oceanica]
MTQNNRSLVSHDPLEGNGETKRMKTTTLLALIICQVQKVASFAPSPALPSSRREDSSLHACRRAFLLSTSAAASLTVLPGVSNAGIDVSQLK